MTGPTKRKPGRPRKVDGSGEFARQLTVSLDAASEAALDALALCWADDAGRPMSASAVIKAALCGVAVQECQAMYARELERVSKERARHAQAVRTHLIHSTRARGILGG